MALSWLFPRIITYTPTLTPDGGFSYYDGGLIHYDVEHTADKYVARQIFSATNKHTGNGRGSTGVPPYHYHPYQDESFDIREGTMCYVVNGKEGTLQKGERLTSPAGDRHTFWCLPGAKQDLDVVITASGSVNGPGSFDGGFLRNFHGYVDACIRSGRSPNPLQIFRFLDDAAVVLADVPFDLGWLLNVLIGKS